MAQKLASDSLHWVPLDWTCALGRLRELGQIRLQPSCQALERADSLIDWRNASRHWLDQKAPSIPRLTEAGRCALPTLQAKGVDGLLAGAFIARYHRVLPRGAA